MALGISRTTVSNAYSRPDQLSSEMRERILTMAHDLGYPGPHPSARALARGRTGVIGVVFPEALTFAVSDPAATASMAGMAAACDELGMALMLIPTHAESASGMDVVRSAACDGLILYSLPDDHELLETSENKHIPLASIDQPRLAAGVRLGADDAAVGRVQIEHLTGLGHRRLALVGYRFGADAREGFQTPDRLRSSDYLMNRERIMGMDLALSAAGLSPDDLIVFEAPETSVAAGERAVTQLLSAHPDLTGIVVDSDTLARGVIDGAQALGRPVPQELSVIGADDNADATRGTPTLTTVSTGAREKGYRAVLTVAGRLDSHLGQDLLVAAELMVRQSTAPAQPSAES